MSDQSGKVKVRYWSHFTEPDRWYCWVYVYNFNFARWMERYCPTASYEFRFNSGDPMFTVRIFDEKEALLFQLKWEINGD